MSRATSVVLVALCVAVAAGGCSSGTGTPRAHRPSAPASPSTAMVTWVGDVCAADEDLQTQQASAGTAAAYITGRGGGTRSQLAGFVAAVRRGLAGTRTALARIPSTSTPGGNALVAAYRKGVDGALAKLAQAEKDAKNPANDPSGLGMMPHAVSVYVRDAGPAGTDLPTLIARQPALRTAFHRAHRCAGSRPLTARKS